MAAKALPVVNRLYYIPKPDIFSRGVPSKLPEAYRRFYEEWMAPAAPVHYRPEPGKWKRDPLTGVVTPVQNVPIPIKYPKEAHTGVWGGEGVILGNKMRKQWFEVHPTRWLVPILYRSVVYSEILDKRLSVIITKRTIEMIVQHQGFDNYILETSTTDLKSLLALKIKKKMLLALFDKTLYPDDPDKKETIYNKYHHHLSKFKKEDLEWYALSIGEAVAKLQKMEDEVQLKPLKHQYRTELIEELKAMAENKELEKFVKDEKEQSWIRRVNPFGKK